MRHSVNSLYLDGIDDYIEIQSSYLYTANAGAYEVTFSTNIEDYSFINEGATLFARYTDYYGSNGIGIYINPQGKLYTQVKADEFFICFFVLL